MLAEPLQERRRLHGAARVFPFRYCLSQPQKSANAFGKSLVPEFDVVHAAEFRAITDKRYES
jgi:hypothetical protein